MEKKWFYYGVRFLTTKTTVGHWVNKVFFGNDEEVITHMSSEKIPEHYGLDFVQIHELKSNGEIFERKDLKEKLFSGKITASQA